MDDHQKRERDRQEKIKSLIEEGLRDQATLDGAARAVVTQWAVVAEVLVPAGEDHPEGSGIATISSANERPWVVIGLLDAGRRQFLDRDADFRHEG